MTVDNVANRAALAAIAPAAGKATYLTELWREGVFVFDPSNLSAAVAADTLQGIYVAPNSDTSGASGAWVRKYDKEVSVRWFGAVGNGSVDDKAAFQAALNSGAARVLVPATAGGVVYRVSGSLTIPTQCELVGAGHWTAVIKSDGLSAPILMSTGTLNGAIRNLNLCYNGTPLDGAHAVLLDNCQTWSLTDLWVSSSWNGVKLAGGGNNSIINYRCYTYENTAILVAGSIDCALTNFRFNAGDSVKGRLGGIRLEGPVEAFTASQGDITLGNFGITTDIYGSTQRGSAPYFNRISQVYFDSTKQQCAWLRGLSHTDFVGCWFASAGHDEQVGWNSAGNYSGIDMDRCSHVRFIGGDAYNNGGYGALIYNTNKFIRFEGMSFKRNGYSRTSSVAGIQALAGTTDLTVQGCQFEKDSNTTLYRMTESVNVQAGASDRYIVADNLLGGCTLFDGGSGVNKRVQSNY